MNIGQLYGKNDGLKLQTPGFLMVTTILYQVVLNMKAILPPRKSVLLIQVSEFQYYENFILYEG